MAAGDHIRFGLVPLLLAVWMSGAAGEQGPFTLEQIMSAPFPTELVAAPGGGKVAWVLNARGVRNLWVAGPPDYVGHPLTAYSEDDGQAITDLQWTPDAGAIVYVRGGNPNRQGEYPNPHSDPQGSEQALWVIPFDGGEPRRLGQGQAPAVSPRGDYVAFIKKGQIWWVPLDGSQEPSRLIHARWLEAYHAAADFLDRHLKPRR